MKDITAESRWNSLMLERSAYLDRAIKCSRLTIPSLIPDSDQYSSRTGVDNSLPSLFQGTGARGVNGLSTKLLLALYPPQQPFFRLTLDRVRLQEYVQNQGGDEETITAQVDQSLSTMERAILARLEKLQARAAIFEACKHLVVGGNGLLYVGQDGCRFYSLRSYVVQRDPEGNVSEIVVKEMVHREFLPAEVGYARSKSGGGTERDDEPVCVYTHVSINPASAAKQVQWYQEAYGERISGSAGFSTIEGNPWTVLRMNRIAGESYGRGLVEEVIGDLNSLEKLTQAIVEGSLIAAKTVFLVNPNGVTRADVIARSENGAIVAGNIADVEALQAQKQQDYSTALQTMGIIERRLQFVFMNTESIQRDAERVTAEEIRLMAEQLEQTLGGTYTVLSQEMQLPLIRRVMAVMERDGDLPAMPDDLVEAQITTGLDAIGRGNDKARLTSFLQIVSAAVGPEQFIKYIKPTELFARFAAADGIDVQGLIKTEQELQQEQAQAQQLMLEQQIASSQLGSQGPGAAGPAAGNGAGQQAAIPAQGGI